MNKERPSKPVRVSQTAADTLTVCRRILSTHAEHSVLSATQSVDLVLGFALEHMLATMPMLASDAQQLSSYLEQLRAIDQTSNTTKNPNA